MTVLNFSFRKNALNRPGFGIISIPVLVLLLMTGRICAQYGDLSMNTGSTGDGIGRVSFVDNGNFNSGNGAIFSCSPSSVSNYSGSLWSNGFVVTPKPFFPVGTPWPYGFSWYCTNTSLGGHPAYNTSVFMGHLQISFMYNIGAGNKWNYFLMKLNSPLQEGVEYLLKADLAARITVPGADDVYLDRIGFALLDTLPTSTYGAFLPGIVPDFETPAGQVMTSTPYQVNHTVVGSGQQYLVIGVFNPTDQMTFEGTLDNAYTAKYLLDNVLLYNPNCLSGSTPSPHVYFTTSQDDQYACADQNATFTPTSGFSPYTWAVDGVVQPTSLSYFDFTGDDMEHVITVSCDTGSCTTTDTAYFHPRMLQLSMPSDTLFPCADELNLDQTLTKINVNTSYWSVNWSGLNSGFTSSWSTTNTSNPVVDAVLPEPDTYAVHITFYSTCHYYDTIHVLPHLALLTDEESNPLLTPIIGTEHCVNMYDGYVAFNPESYPLPLHYDWITPAGIPGDVSAAMALTTGNYGVIVYDSIGRCDAYNPFVPQNLSSCSYIHGRVKFDPEYNCQNASAHLGNPNQMVAAMPLGNFAITDTAGYYSIPVPPGSYTATRIYSNSYLNAECQSNTSVNLPNPGMTAQNVNFVDTVHVSTIDLNFTSLNTSTALVINEYRTLSCLIRNDGDTAVAGLVKMLIGADYLEPETDGVLGYAGMTGDTLLFDVPVIEPGEYWGIHLPFLIPQNTDIIGDIVEMEAWLLPISDANPEGNYKIIEREILGAYDPNMKTVSPVGYTAEHYVSNVSPGFDYTIYFQNTGNYPATTVRIEDHLAEHFIPSSLQLTDYSHAVEVSYFDGMLEFLFDDIMLPDSTSDPEGSQGYVSFRIEAQSGLPQGSLLENTAYIFFDANPAIITNTVSNTIFDCNAFDAAFTTEWTPCTEELNCSFPSTWVEQSSWSLNGAMVSTGEDVTLNGVPGMNTVTHMIYNPACGTRIDSSVVMIPENNTTAIDFSSQILCGSVPVILSSSLNGASYEWTLNGEVLGNAQELVVTEPGNYELSVSYDNCAYNASTEILEGNATDFNNDGITGVADLNIMLGDFGCLSGCIADVDDNSFVGTSDLIILIGHWNMSCFE